PNHPKKGSSTVVDPIRDEKHIKAIRKILSDNQRNHLLFVMGINNGLRTGDLLKLKVMDVRGLKEGDKITIKEGKTGKQNILVINKTVHKVLIQYLMESKLKDDDYLFKSRKGNRPISIQTVNGYLKKWTSEINIKGNYGAHSLRKTWGYFQRKIFGVGFEVLCKRYNHASPAITMRYLGITDREVENILTNNEIG
ncbi:MAG: tyrosine-type recombinase/integrase, partial [Smithellaceae bacterium]|nr:tyrosine-type recombinase/integrase [Smithellaceae bacterium]